MDFGNIVRFWGQWQPNEIALSFEGRDLTWAELDQSTTRLANGLLDAGLTCGDRVGVLLTNCVEYMELIFACAKSGIVLVPLNIRLSPPELLFVANHAGCSLIVTDPEMSQRLLPVLNKLTAASVYDTATPPTPGLAPFSDLRSPLTRDDSFHRDPEDILFLCYTSGTTGRPKGAMLSHRAIYSTAVAMTIAHRLTAADCTYLPFPLAFVGGLDVMISTVLPGARLVLDRQFDAKRALELWLSVPVTAFHAVPVIYEQIAAQPGFADADLSRLRVSGVGGSPVPPSLTQTFLAKGVSMTQGFGLTEACGFDLLVPRADIVRKPSSCGIPTLQLEARLVDENGHDVGVNSVGEILLRGPQVMSGYWNDPAATRATLDEDSWLHTGDLAVMDSDGHFSIVDRQKDMIISGGLNVYPAEIERVLSAIDGVIEAAVIGTHDDRWAEVPAAIVVTDQALDIGQIVQHCRASLADYKIPHYVLLSNEPLPRNMGGKVTKTTLRERFESFPESARVPSKSVRG